LDKDKIPLLNNNDIVYFQDSANNNKIDTFRIDIGEIWHYTTEEDYLQYIQIYYNKLNRQTTFFSIYISPSGGGSMFVVDNYYRLTNTKNNFTLQGVTYPVVYIGYCNSYDLSSDTIPNLVYYTYHNGIIRYEYKDGRVYELMK